MDRVEKIDRTRLRQSFLTLGLTFGLSWASVASAKKRKRRKKSSNFMLGFFTFAHFQRDLFISEGAIRFHNGAKENITKEYITQPKKIK
jgi:hypothetical protein